jgi:hypothetical protein
VVAYAPAIADDQQTDIDRLDRLIRATLPDLEVHGASRKTGISPPAAGAT